MPGGGQDGGASPSKKPKQKRPKIISPSRQKYETVFESYFVNKYTEKKLHEQKENEVADSSEEERSPSPNAAAQNKSVNQSQIVPKITKEEPFDLVTKLVGSINKKVQDRQRKSIERLRRRQEKKQTKR